MQSNDQELRLHMMPARAPAEHYSELYFAAFACWVGVWSETFRELTQKDKMPSDDFSRQDEIMALFRGPKCIGMVFIRSESFADPAIWHDSYFSAWPAFAIHRLMRHGPTFTIVSYMTGAQDERGKPIEGKMKIQELLMALSSLRFLELGTSVMVGTPRLAVGMGNSCAQAGATRILVGQKMYGVDVECLEFTRENVSQIQFDELVYKTWNTRVLHSRELDKNNNLRIIGGYLGNSEASG